MNASLWQLAGWTMIHSLWLGAAVALAGGFLRLACRRAAPNTRYAISLATLAALAVTPLATASWLSVNGVPTIETALLPLPQGEGWGGGQPGYTASHPSLTLPLKGRESEEHVAGQIIDLAHTSPSPRYSGERLGEGQNPPSTTPQPSATVENPSPNPSLPRMGTAPTTYSPTHLLTYSLPHLPTLWLIGAPLTFTLLATGLLGSARLRRRATPLTAGPAFDACERLRQTLNITRRVALAVSDGVAQPILVGVLRPLILLPTAALAGWTPEQLDMVLLHELAHVRRWDNLVNLLQRIVESLLFFHPAVWLLSRQVRRDREECCDAAVIRHTNRPHQYAELLVTIAAALRGGPAPSLAVASAMASHPLAGRIRRILNIEAEPMRITRRTLAATLLLPLLLAGAIFYSGASAEDAQNPPPSKEQPSTVASGERAQRGSEDAGGITDANQPSIIASDDKEMGDAAKEATAEISAEPQPATIKAAEGIALKVYPISNLPSNIDLRQWMELVASDPRIEIQWMPKEKGLLIAAPERIHNELQSLLNGARKKATTSEAQSNHSETSQLQNEIRNLEDLIAKARKELVDIEASKELSVRNLNIPATIDASIAMMLDSNPTIQQQKKQLLDLNSTLQTKLSASKSPDDADVKRLRASMQEAEAELAKRRSEAESTLREKFSKMNNEVLRSAMTEYKIRRKSVEDNLAEHQQKLMKCRQIMETMHSPTGSLQEIGTYATPSIAVAEAVQRHGKNEGQIAKPNALEAFDNAKSADERQTAFKQFAQIFKPSDANPLATATYSVPAGDDMRERIEGIFAGFEMDPYGPKIAESIRRWSPDNRSVEITAPRLAHDQYLSYLFARIAAKAGEPPATDESVMAAGSPGSPNQGGAATGSGANDAQPSTMASPNSTAPVPQPSPAADSGGNAPQTDLRAVLAETKHRLERQLAELKQRAGAADGTEEESAAATALEQKILEWEAMNRARRANESLLPNGPDSPNQDGAATQGSTENATPNSEASPGSAARVQEPEPPSPFPTLENQKIADRAYKLLGLELETLSVEDLERVNRLGYTGGLKVTQVTTTVRDAQDSLYASNLLVGLHVWPVTDLASLDEILRRPDLGELAPLKYYAIRKDETRANRSAPADELTTGRLSIPEAELLSRDLETANRVRAEFAAVRVPNDSASISVMQAPTSQKTSIFGGTVTTAYLNVKFNLLPGAFSGAPETFNVAAARLTPQAIELQARNCLAIIKSPNLLKAALAVITPRETVDMQPAKAAEWLKNRLSATFPGNGEILELKLEGGDAKEDNALLQAVIDAFLAAMKAPPESPADPKAASDSAAAPGDLSHYVSPAASPALTAESSDVAPYKHPAAFAEALEQSRKTGKPVIVHLLTHNSEPSERFADEVLTDSQVADFIAKNFESSVTIYVDDEPAFAKVFHISLVPANMFIFAGGERITGGVPVQATPAAYLTHLQQYYKIAISPTISKADAATVPDVPPVAVADRPGGENRPIENEKPTFLYDGKTFDQWRDLWKLELNPERRIEAINALATLGKTGYGAEAADAILDVAGQYDRGVDADSAEGKLIGAIDEAMAHMPADLWMPRMQAKIKGGDDASKKRWRAYARQFLMFSRDKRPEARIWAAKFADDPADGLLYDAAMYLLQNDQNLEDPLTVELVRKSLHEGVDHKMAYLMLQFRNLDKVPEQLDALVRDHRARQLLQQTMQQDMSEEHAPELIASMLAILNDPDRADDHVGAIRTLRAMYPALRRRSMQAERLQVVEQLTTILRDGPDELLLPACAALGHLTETSADSIPAEYLQEGKISAERAKRLREFDQQELIDEANAD
ncbi:MAG: hypothetical protein C0485_00745 [Pirellula sp.]|nr:hypothetical protein [Pirellula sp.]